MFQSKNLNSPPTTLKPEVRSGIFEVTCVQQSLLWAYLKSSKNAEHREQSRTHA